LLEEFEWILFVLTFTFSKIVIAGHMWAKCEFYVPTRKTYKSSNTKLKGKFGLAYMSLSIDINTCETVW
jgi:hypothetical protein